jgi:hypothetical protein
MVQGGAITLLLFFINMVMANPIRMASGIISCYKYVNYAIEVLQKDAPIAFIKEKNGGGDPIMLNPTKRSRDLAIKILKTFIEGNKLRADIADLNAYKNAIDSIELDTSKEADKWFSVGSIMKSSEKVPFGYLAEVLLQAAIVARFVEGRTGGSINTAHVAKYIKQFLVDKSDSGAYTAVKGPSDTKKSIAKAFKYTVPNKKASVGIDTVYAFYVLNGSAFTYLNARKSVLASSPDLAPYIVDACRYVNSGACKEHAEYFYNNGRRDRIDIVSTSISGQDKKNPSKADIVTAYYEGWSGNDRAPGKPIAMKLNLSVKINHITQVGQASGLHSEAMKTFASAVGMTLSTTTINKINKINLEPITPQSQTEVYKLVYNEMSKASDIDKLINGISYFISFNDKTINVVDIGAGLKVYFVENLQMLKKQFKGKKVSAKTRVTGGGNYVLDVYLGDSQILELSSRKTGGIYRNFVNTGDALRNILSKPL